MAIIIAVAISMTIVAIGAFLLAEKSRTRQQLHKQSRMNSNIFVAVIITCGVLLSCFLLAETVSGSPFVDIIGSDEPFETAAESSALNKGFTVLKTNSTISEPIFNSTTSEITFTVTGPSGTQGYI